MPDFEMRVLSLEDMPSDAELIYAALRRSGLGFTWHWVANRDDFLAALHTVSPTVILTDYNLPGYDGESAILDASRELPGVPVIVVTGTLGEEKAIQLLHLGAVDYILKDRMARLPGAVSRAVENARDLRMRKEAQAALVESESLLRQAQAIAHLGSWRWEFAEDLIYFSEEAYRIFGLFPEVSVGKPPYEFLRQITFNEDIEKILRQMEDARQAQGICNCEVRILRPEGAVRWVHGQAQLVRDKSGGPVKLIGTLLDITEQKNSESQIRYLAQHDALTGLPNREHLRVNIESALYSSKRNGTHLALMFLDLDRFKDVNDNLGHHVGDQLLIALAQRIQGLIREEDTVSRQGGDEFVMLFPHTHAEGASTLAEKFIELFSRPFILDEHEISVTASIGVAIYPEDGEDIETLTRHADAAMYRAKDTGRNTYCFYTPELQVRMARKLMLINELRHAISRDELKVHYQPQVNIHSRKIVGAEALLRWNHPVHGFISPAEFVPLAEESGLIIPIGDWVLDQAIRQTKRWHERGHTHMLIAVNLSAVQFKHHRLAERITTLLDQASLPYSALELELTESTTMDDPVHASEMMRQLHAVGIRLSIDDFGTGYSSMSYLKRFNVEKIKIDQSFVRDLDSDPDDVAIVNSIIQLSHSLGSLAIAEGVETEAQRSMLESLGCDQIQGYLISPAVSAEQFDVLIARLDITS